ncbi:sodium-independent sulfate anion transporter isoform X3 [Hydra vulgaris]|uniref:sodium-independent sulfate anion transporter isoform X3 n=2 Tax=Hydra vulgaris TaxID=6087 RepID=UPI001F5F9DC9|nr:sodium-independent sulfate anion transporter isoform X1 [Hydra vulgaris]
MSKNVSQFMIEKVKQFNFFKTLCSFFPIIVWLPKYNLKKLKGDLIAGLTVGIMVIPQSIAFANLAGLPIQYGLYTSLTPGLIYCIFGTSKDANVGATATMSLFTHNINTTKSPIGASLLAFWCGIILTAVGIFKLGFVTKFVPFTIISAFVSAASITIAISQFPNLLGIKGAPTTSFPILDYLRQKIKLTNKYDVTLGIICIVYLAFFMWLSKIKLNNSPKRFALVRKLCNKFIWVVCLARLILVCFFSAIIVYIFFKNGKTQKFTLAGNLTKGMPKCQSPFATAQLGKNITMSTSQFTRDFGISILVLSMIQFIEQYSITKGFGRKFNYKVSARQELIALGMCNIAGSFYGGWPVAGSFSRSAVNSMSGAQTPLAGAFSFIVVIIALELLTPALSYIPKSALAAMIIMAVITMVETRVLKSIWKLSKWDLFPFFTTFWLCFYNLEYGILAGTGISLIYVIAREAFPKYCVNKDEQNNSITILLKTNLSYPGSETLNRKIHSIVRKNDGIKNICLNLSNTSYLDFSVLKAFETLQNELSELSIKLCFIGVTKESLRKQLEFAGLTCELKEQIELQQNKQEEEVYRRPTVTQPVLLCQDTIPPKEEENHEMTQSTEVFTLPSIITVDNIHFKDQ